MTKPTKANIFAKNIRFLRRIVGLFSRRKPFTQEEFSNEIGITRRTVIFWESGQIPQSSKLEAISRYFTKKLSFEITPKMLIETELSRVIEYSPAPEFALGMGIYERQILSSLFLSAKELSPVDRKKVLNYIARLKRKK